MGGKSSSSSAANTTNNNIDNRLAVQDGVGLTNSSGNSVSLNSTGAVQAVATQSTDAVRAVAALGSDVLRNVGGAVVDLNRDSMQANAAAWDRTVTVGAGLVDKLIDATTEQIKSGQRATEQIAEKGFGISQAAISGFMPAENKASDTSLKLGMIAAAAVAATLLLRKA